MIRPQLEPLADDAMLLRLGSEIDPAVNARIVDLAARIRAERFAWLRDVVPAYGSVAVFFDPAALSDNAHDQVAAALLRIHGEAATPDSAVVAPRVQEIPVHYGGDDGPDLDECARQLGLSAAEVVSRHCAPEYRVAMIGFAPGFPYLLGLDPSLAVPRLATPRTRVPAGSVGIGGAQTGVYPRDSAGGWRLIGRTPLALFDPRRKPASLLQAGDRVRFVPTPGPCPAMRAAE